MLNRKSAASLDKAYQETDSFFERERRGHMLQALISLAVLVLIVQTVYILSHREELLSKYAISRVTDPAAILRGQAIYLYSTTDCAPCRTMADEFVKNAIPFREFYVDTDPSKQSDMYMRAELKQIPRDKVVVPGILVNTDMYFGRISLAELAVKVKKK